MEETELAGLMTPQERSAGFEAMKPQESTMGDYWDAINVYALKGTRPELQTTDSDYTGPKLDTTTPEFKALVEMADVPTQFEMYGAVSNDHADKIYNSRKIQREAMERISGDPLTTQLFMGAIPAVISPTSLLPVGGAAFTLFKVGKAASRITAATRAGLAAGAAGGIANVGDELIIGAQDLHTDYQSALMFGAAFSAPFGFMGGLITGPLGKINAEVSHGASDTYKTDFKNDPDVIIRQEGGAPKMDIVEQGAPATKTTLQAQGSTSTERQSKYLLDKIPFISDLLNSDITKAYMHESAVGRGIMTKLVTPSTALYDKVGNAIAVGRTAMDFKLTQKAINNRKDLAISQAFTEAQKNGFTGSRANFVTEVSDTFAKAANKQSKDLADHLHVEGNKFDNAYGDARDVYIREAKGEIDPLRLDVEADKMHANKRRKAMEKARDEFYAKNKGEFKNKSAEIRKGAEAYRTFYNEHLKTNKDLDMTGTKSTPDGKLYAPRLMDWDKFKNEEGFLRKFEEDAYRAFKSHGTNTDLDEKTLRELAAEYREVISNVNTRQQFTHGSFLAPTLSGDARMKGRKFDMDEEIMASYRMLDAEELAGRYHYQMAGRQAVQYAFGTHNVGEIMKKVTDEMMAKEGKVSNDMLRYIENTVQDLSGQLRMNALSDSPAWQVTRSIQVFNSARLGGGFGGNQFIELAASMMMNHLPSVLAGRTGKSFSNVAKVLYSKDKNMDDFNRYIINSGFMEDALHTSRVNRFADTEAGWNSGAVEKGLHWFTDKMYKYNGMRYFKGVMEDMAGGAMLKEIPMMAKKGENLSKGDKARLARWGLDKDTLQDLARDIEKNLTDDNFNIAAMSEKNRDQLQLAIQRGIAETVIQGDSLHLPTWMKVPTPMKSLIFQFMRFPMIAHSTYMRRGMTDDQARMAAAVVASTVTFMGMKYIREQASMALGLTDERDSKYNYFDSRDGVDNMMRSAIESTNYIAPLGMWTAVANTGSNMFMGTELGSEYRGTSTMEDFMGPTFGGLGPDLLEVMQNAATGNLSDERMALKVKSLLPGANLPLVNEAFKYSIEENF